MSFFFSQTTDSRGRVKSKKAPVSLSETSLLKLQSQGCAACTLNTIKSGNSKIKASGSKKPLLYFLNEQPLIHESDLDFINSCLGRYGYSTRFNSLVRCHSHKMPSRLELECCRQSIISDIEENKPKVIIGLGSLILKWLFGENLVGGVYNWRGKKVPVKIGKHKCWFVSVTTVNHVMSQRKYGYNEKLIDDKHGHIFKLDVKYACSLLDMEVPVIQQKGFLEGCDSIYGKGLKDYDLVSKGLDELCDYEAVAVDIETKGLRPYADTSKLLTISFGVDEHALSFPIEHGEGWSSRKLKSKVLKLVEDFLYNGPVQICQNLKFEQEFFAYYFGKRLLRSANWEDTMSMAYALDERKKVHSLAFLTLQYLGFNVKALSPKMDMNNLDKEPLTKILPYNSLDSKYTYILFYEILKDLEQRDNKNLRFTYDYHVDLSTTLVLSQMEGLNPDNDAVSVIGDDLQVRVDKLKKAMSRLPEVSKCNERFGDFNPSSDDHIHYIFDVLLDRPEVRLKDDKVSVSESVLKKMPKSVRLANLLLDYRNATKLKSTYIDSVKGHVYPDGLMHTNYTHTFTSTGRLSSEEPNSQNYPSRKDKYIRKIIIPKPGCLLASFDYGQIDARNIAMASGDEYYINALWNGLDIHMDWTEKILKKYPNKLDAVAKAYSVDRDDEELVVKCFRKDVKNQWTFPLFYGIHASGAAYYLGIPDKVIKPLFDEFWDVFKGVKKWQDEVLRFYDKYGYVETLNGRRRHGPMKKEEIINTIIQGASAEIVGDAMNRCSELAYPPEIKNKVWLPDSTYQPPMQIHDDLTFNLRDDAYFENTALDIAKVMCDVPFDWVNVPIVVELVAGYNWYDQTVYKKEYRSNEIL